MRKILTPLVATVVINAGLAVLTEKGQNLIDSKIGTKPSGLALTVLIGGLSYLVVMRTNRKFMPDGLVALLTR